MNPSDTGPYFKKTYYNQWIDPWAPSFLMRINFASRTVEMDGTDMNENWEKHQKNWTIYKDATLVQIDVNPGSVFYFTL
jgi:hypothetical protein